MANWKRVLGFGSIVAGVILCIKGKRSAGAVVATIGAATLVSEYPDEIKTIAQQAPVWMDRTNRVLAIATKVADRLART